MIKGGIRDERECLYIPIESEITHFSYRTPRTKSI